MDNLKHVNILQILEYATRLVREALANNQHAEGSVDADIKQGEPIEGWDTWEMTGGYKIKITIHPKNKA